MFSGLGVRVRFHWLSFITAWGGIGKITGGLRCFGKGGCHILKSPLRGGAV